VRTHPPTGTVSNLLEGRLPQPTFIGRPPGTPLIEFAELPRKIVALAVRLPDDVLVVFRHRLRERRFKAAFRLATSGLRASSLVIVRDADLRRDRRSSAQA
jgi:hypothetical protein